MSPRRHLAWIGALSLVDLSLGPSLARAQVVPGRVGGTSGVNLNVGGLGGVPGGYGFGGPGYQLGPYGYGINQGLIGPGYGSPYGTGLHFYGGYGYGVPTQGRAVINYQPLVNAITSIPGWYGHPTRSHHPVRPSVPPSQLLQNDGTILWPAGTPSDPAVADTRAKAEAAVKAVAEENTKYGSASVRSVIDARKALTDFAAKALPELKPRNAEAADGLERFVVELQKTLATMAVNY